MWFFIFVAPDSPVDVNADFNSTSTITLTWNDPHTANTMSNYSFGIEKVLGDERTNVTRDTTINIERKNANFTGLTAGTQYCVSVYTVLHPRDFKELQSTVITKCSFIRK